MRWVRTSLRLPESPKDNLFLDHKFNSKLYENDRESLLLLFLALHLALHSHFDSSLLQFFCVFLGHYIRKTNNDIKYCNETSRCLITVPANDRNLVDT